MNYSGSSAENVSSDAAVTLDSPTNLISAYVINCPAASTKYAVDVPLQSVLGEMPYGWGFVIQNRTGFALGSTAANFLSYHGGMQYVSQP